MMMTMIMIMIMTMNMTMIMTMILIISMTMIMTCGSYTLLYIFIIIIIITIITTIIITIIIIIVIVLVLVVVAAVVSRNNLSVKRFLFAAQRKRQARDTFRPCCLRLTGTSVENIQNKNNARQSLKQRAQPRAPPAGAQSRGRETCAGSRRWRGGGPR